MTKAVLIDPTTPDYAELIERLEKVEPDTPGEGVTRYYRNPDGPGAAAALRTLQEENEALADALRGVLKAYENALEWYDYLLSEHIDQKEAERRLRLLRQARRAAPAAGGGRRLAPPRA